MTFVSRNPSLCWAGAAAIFGFAAVYSKLTGRFEPYSGGPLHYLWALLAACVLLPAVFGGESAGIPRRVLSTPFIAWLGLVSYGVFLWHQPILGKVSAAITHWFHLDPAGGLGLALLVVIGGTASVALGAASYYVVERPFLALKDARFHRR